MPLSQSSDLSTKFSLSGASFCHNIFWHTEPRASSLASQAPNVTLVSHLCPASSPFWWSHLKTFYSQLIPSETLNFSHPLWSPTLYPPKCPTPYSPTIQPLSGLSNLFSSFIPSLVFIYSVSCTESSLHVRHCSSTGLSRGIPHMRPCIRAVYMNNKERKQIQNIKTFSVTVYAMYIVKLRECSFNSEIWGKSSLGSERAMK